jgi:hypothetical protein
MSQTTRLSRDPRGRETTSEPVVHDDGTEHEIGQGQAYVIEPGHDAWVVGDEPFMGFEFESQTAEQYAKSS